MYYKQEIGKKGENLATDFLEKEGCKIIDRNFNCWWGEIDIIAKDRDEIVFVEVKTRNNKKYGQASEAINKNKKAHIKKTIEYYLYSKKIKNVFNRIDVIEIYYFKNKIKINHIKKAIE